MKKIYTIMLSVLVIFMTVNLVLVNAEELPKITSTVTLKRGANNNVAQVKILQQRLNAITHCNLEVDGKMGSKTEWCVKKYQEENNLEIDGKVGPATRKNINNYTSVSADKTYTIVNDTKLNVRASSDASSKDIGDVYKGEVYEVFQTVTKSTGKKWYKIKYNGTYGWISGSYVTNSAIVVDISDQTLKLIKGGKLKLTAPVVTGTKGENDTPTGSYKIGYVEGYTVLKGKDYETPVNFWMPFIGRSYGFHDASSWRSNANITNKNTYLTNGSHGCVNMIYEDAEYLHDNIYVGLKVFINK